MKKIITVRRKGPFPQRTMRLSAQANRTGNAGIDPVEHAEIGIECDVRIPEHGFGFAAFVEMDEKIQTGDLKEQTGEQREAEAARYAGGNGL